MPIKRTIPKVTNMRSPISGREVANQFQIDCGNKIYFQSYDTIIAMYDRTTGQVTLNKSWKWSNTTSKYRNIFLMETTKETEHKVKTGKYKLRDLNK